MDQQGGAEPASERGQVREKPGHASEEGKAGYEIDIFEAWCKSCGICAAFCPRNCISLTAEGSAVITRPERCTGCGWCEIHCPDFAISVNPDKSIRNGPEDEEE